MAKPPEFAGASEVIKFDFLEFMNIYNLEKSGKHKSHAPEVSKQAQTVTAKTRPRSPNQPYKMNAVQE